MSIRSTSGRSLLLVLIVAVLAVLAVVVLLLADPFGLSLRDGTHHEDPFSPESLDALEDAGGEGQEPSSGISLAGRYGEGDLGAVRLRLLNIDGRKPFPDQPLSLLAGGPTFNES